MPDMAVSVVAAWSWSMGTTELLWIWTEMGLGERGLRLAAATISGDCSDIKGDAGCGMRDAGCGMRTWDQRDQKKKEKKPNKFGAET